MCKTNMCVFLAKTICIGITVFYIHCTCRWWWTTWGVLYKKQELLTFLKHLSSPSFCRGLCCCSMFLFSFLCDVVLCWYLSSCAPFCFCPRISPTLMKLLFSSFSVHKSMLFGSWTWRNFKLFDNFTITGLVDFPSDNEHSTSTFRSVWSFPTVFSNNSPKLVDFFKFYSIFGLIIFPFSQTELKTFVESFIIAHLTCV